MAKIRTLTSVEQIKSSTAISEKGKSLLEEFPKSDITALSQWTRRVIAQLRRDGNTDAEIANCIQVYANKGSWHPKYVYEVLSNNGIELYNRYGRGKSQVSGIYLPLVSFKKIAMGLSGMEESDIMQADYSPTRIRKASEGGLRQWTARMDETDLREFPRWLKIVVAQFEEAIEMMEQKKVSRVKYGV